MARDGAHPHGGAGERFEERRDSALSLDGRGIHASGVFDRNSLVATVSLLDIGQNATLIEGFIRSINITANMTT